MSGSGLELHVVLAALLIDAAVGDPAWFYRRVPHPVVALGKLVELSERWLYRASPRWLCGLGGAATVAVVVGAGVAAGWSIERFLIARWPHGWVLEGVIASTLIAFRGLHDHALAVADGLDRSLDAGREAVSHIVGRDPASLDEAGVARGAIESVAENFSDGVVAPLFWYGLAGLPGLIAYKAVNTLDSMIGHRTERYRHFGTAAARLDDAVNWLPARLAGLYFVAAAWLRPGANGARAARVMVRDAGKHRSPNAGWQEAAVAGALDLALAGPRRYRHETVDDAWMGDGRAELDAGDIRRALHLYITAGTLVAATLATLATSAALGWLI
ncbi:MAG: adenosylcobinamide-phosphate synthase CbiB [Thiotrichales bacterium]|nr:adenosylcobinamide-phosphate synthase CbiB [Thiotrichales bacterium]